MQQNINRSPNAQADLIHKATNYDIIIIQEPYIDFLGNTRANSHWRTIYPTGHLDKPKAIRSVILINAKILTDVWTQIQFPHPDVTGVIITTDSFNLRIINVYNSQETNETIALLQRWITNLE